MIQVVATALVLIPAAAVGATPVSGPPLSVRTVPINTSAGSQTDPHVSGDLAAYTSETSDGHSEIRVYAFDAATDEAIPNQLGDGNRAPTPAEPDRMKGLVREAMREGAIGISTSLQYAPAPYASTEELIALAAEAGKLGGIYATHMRSEGDAITAAIDEAVRIGREARLPVEIWHLKASGQRNWGRMPQIVAQIEKARQSGVEVGANTYAYPAWFNNFSAFIPPWAHDGGSARLLERLKDPPTRVRIHIGFALPER